MISYSTNQSISQLTCRPGISTFGPVTARTDVILVCVVLWLDHRKKLKQRSKRSNEACERFWVKATQKTHQITTLSSCSAGRTCNCIKVSMIKLASCTLNSSHYQNVFNALWLKIHHHVCFCYEWHDGRCDGKWGLHWIFWEDIWHVFYRISTHCWSWRLYPLERSF